MAIAGQGNVVLLDPVRNALVRAKGVKKAEVSFEKKQATVTYDAALNRVQECPMIDLKTLALSRERTAGEG